MGYAGPPPESWQTCASDEGARVVELRLFENSGHASGRDGWRCWRARLEERCAGELALEKCFKIGDAAEERCFEIHASAQGMVEFDNGQNISAINVPFHVT